VRTDARRCCIHRAGCCNGTPSINARSTMYTSDIGKMIHAPVIHVNGDHPEAVAHAASIAFE
jgi:probable 2-oxoglutarate dehydrogenase E1 component DHKTD1